MLQNHLNVFEIKSSTINVAGEESEPIIKKFDNSNGDGEMLLEINGFIEKEIGIFNHIDRMELELNELVEKRNKALYFLEKEEEFAKFTDCNQRELLSKQLDYMLNYINVLKDRIEYDKKKMEEK